MIINISKRKFKQWYRGIFHNLSILLQDIQNYLDNRQIIKALKS